MSQKWKLSKESLIAALSLCVCLAIGARLCYLNFGPPLVNAKEDPQREFLRLSADYQKDVKTQLSFIVGLQRFQLLDNPIIYVLSSFFYSPNLSKYPSCFLDLALKNLKNRDLSRLALQKTIRLDHGKVGEQALSIFFDKFSDDLFIDQICATMSDFNHSFAKTQLAALDAKSKSPRVHVCAQAALATINLDEGDNAQAMKQFDRASAEIVHLDPADLKEQREQLKNGYSQINHLGLNKYAAEIEGKIQNGTVVRLSDFRKKVICLDFWGDW